ncbi:hypothetical protein ONZ45_g14938 [Pleurotus djamor]|nr:hypothetical protein ONZ45_g14938 [Pleurotus djamor]
MSVTERAKLPQELVEDIINACDFRDLRQCALVASTWVLSCQRRLFRSIQIIICQDSGFSNTTAIHRFRATPHLAAHVQQLYLYPAENNRATSADQLEVVKLLTMFTHLHTLQLRTSDVFDDSNIHPKLRSALLDVIHNRIRNLAFVSTSFRNLAALSKVIGDVDSLSSLGFYNVELRNESSRLPVRENTQPPLPLGSLEIFNKFQAPIRYLTSLRRSILVKRLSVTWSLCSDIGDLVSLLHLSAIEELEVHPEQAPSLDQLFNLDLGLFPNLRELAFPLYTPEVFDFLSTVSPNNHIKYITVTTSLANAHISSPSLLCDVDDVFVSTRFPNLKRVCLVHNDLHSSGRNDFNLFTHVNHSFPQSLARGLIVLEIHKFYGGSSYATFNSWEILDIAREV